MLKGDVCCLWKCTVAGQPESHDNPCPQPKAPTMGMLASKLDHGGMEEGCLVWWTTFSLDQVNGWVGVQRLPGEEMAAGFTMGRRQASRGSVMLLMHVDVTWTHTTYLKIVGGHVHPFMVEASFSRIITLPDSRVQSVSVCWWCGAPYIFGLHFWPFSVAEISVHA